MMDVIELAELQEIDELLYGNASYSQNQIPFNVSVTWMTTLQNIRTPNNTLVPMVVQTGVFMNGMKVTIHWMSFDRDDIIDVFAYQLNMIAPAFKGWIVVENYPADSYWPDLIHSPNHWSTSLTVPSTIFMLK